LTELPAEVRIIRIVPGGFGGIEKVRTSYGEPTGVLEVGQAQTDAEGQGGRFQQVIQAPYGLFISIQALIPGRRTETFQEEGTVLDRTPGPSIAVGGNAFQQVHESSQIGVPNPEAYAVGTQGPRQAGNAGRGFTGLGRGGMDEEDQKGIPCPFQ